MGPNGAGAAKAALPARNAGPRHVSWIGAVRTSPTQPSSVFQPAKGSEKRSLEPAAGGLGRLRSGPGCAGLRALILSSGPRLQRPPAPPVPASTPTRPSTAPRRTPSCSTLPARCGAPPPSPCPLGPWPSSPAGCRGARGARSPQECVVHRLHPIPLVRADGLSSSPALSSQPRAEPPRGPRVSLPAYLLLPLTNSERSGRAAWVKSGPTTASTVKSTPNRGRGPTPRRGSTMAPQGGRRITHTALASHSLTLALECTRVHRYALRTAAARWSRGRVARVLHSTQHTHTLAHSWRGKSTGFTLGHCVSVSLGVEVVVEPGRLEGVAGRRAARRDEGDADAGRSDAARPREGSSTATEEPSAGRAEPSQDSSRASVAGAPAPPPSFPACPTRPSTGPHRLRSQGSAWPAFAQLSSPQNAGRQGTGSARHARRPGTSDGLGSGRSGRVLTAPLSNT